MPDPDSWPILSLLCSLFFLCLCTLNAGALADTIDLKDVTKRRLGASRRAVAALLLCVPFAIWAGVCSFRIAHNLGMLTQPAGQPVSLWYTAVTTISCVVLTIVLLALCVCLPYGIGHANTENTRKYLRFLRPFVALFLPLAVFVTMPAQALLRKRGEQAEVNTVTEEDVLELVDTATEHDFIDENQKEMIGNIFDLGDVTAADIMTHRTEVEAVPTTATVDDIIAKAVELGYSRIPVYDGSLDNIIGIAYVKDFLPYVGKGTKGVEIQQLYRPTLFVPESCRARDLLFDFKQKKIQLAVVVDEYGGTAGIVTMEDILESIVGDIEDEYDEADEYILEKPDGSLLCDGYAEIDDVFDLLGYGEVPEDIDSDTIGGLLTDLLARIPKPGEHASARYQDLELTALDADERRITSVLVQKLAPEDAPAPETT